MSPHSMSDRVATARELLEGWPEEEYDALPADCQANVQEAIEFLASVEREISDDETEESSQELDQSGSCDDPSCTEDWPTFALRFTFNPKSVREERFDPDELFVFDPDRLDVDDSHWIAAERGSYVPIEDVR